MEKCDTCGKKSENGRTVLDSLFICDKCINIILALYSFNHPIRLLCPFCQEKTNINRVCSYCNLDYQMRHIKSVEI